MLSTSPKLLVNFRQASRRLCRPSPFCAYNCASIIAPRTPVGVFNSAADKFFQRGNRLVDLLCLPSARSPATSSACSRNLRIFFQRAESAPRLRCNFSSSRLDCANAKAASAGMRTLRKFRLIIFECRDRFAVIAGVEVSRAHGEEDRLQLRRELRLVRQRFESLARPWRNSPA